MGEVAEAQSRIALGAFDRSEVTVAYRVKAESVVIPSSTEFTTIVLKEIPKGFKGFLLELGHDADAAAFAVIRWRITVDGIPVPGFGGQIGEQWGTISSPGTVFARIGNGKIVALQGQQASGVSRAASAILVGYHWPINNPATPVS